MAWTKTAFDQYRQGIWDQGKSLVDQKNAMQSQGTLTTSTLNNFIGTLGTLMASFTATWQQARQQPGTSSFLGTGGIEDSWIDPRYHDYFDFFTNVLNQWDAELKGMTSAQSTTVVSSPLTAPATTGTTAQYQSTSQAAASSTIQPQPAYVPPPTSLAPTTAPFDPYTTVVQTPVGDQAAASQSAISPLMIGAVVVGALLLLGRKRGA